MRWPRTDSEKFERQKQKIIHKSIENRIKNISSEVSAPSLTSLALNISFPALQLPSCASRAETPLRRPLISLALAAAAGSPIQSYVDQRCDSVGLLADCQSQNHFSWLYNQSSFRPRAGIEAIVCEKLSHGASSLSWEALCVFRNKAMLWIFSSIPSFMPATRQCLACYPNSLLSK